MTKKYRPYFSSEELSEIISALKESPTISRIALIRYLETFAIKINSGLYQSNLTLAPTLEQKLGFKETPSDELNPARQSSVRLAAYLKWAKDPSSCTPIELIRSNEYRYENGIMSESEEHEFETKLMNGV